MTPVVAPHSGVGARARVDGFLGDLLVAVGQGQGQGGGGGRVDDVVGVGQGPHRAERQSVVALGQVSFEDDRDSGGGAVIGGWSIEGAGEGVRAAGEHRGGLDGVESGGRGDGDPSPRGQAAPGYGQDAAQEHRYPPRWCRRWWPRQWSRGRG